MSESDQWKKISREELKEETSTFFSVPNTNPVYDEDIAMEEEERDCCCSEKSLDIADNLTDHSLNGLELDERETMEDGLLIEEADAFNLLDRMVHEREVRLDDKDIFSIELNEFYEE